MLILIPTVGALVRKIENNLGWTTSIRMVYLKPFKGFTNDGITYVKYDNVTQVNKI